ncbi:unnamed protein product [Schistosoma margrebowiei]|uniref:adenine phosphoribosyltransferase n=1 Tax=Schistosoma margrebowiei TaxID=48269 RepID=A0A183LKB6_9TREM|nr:unnamed protein product [Schistosoma margrebowiei]
MSDRDSRLRAIESAVGIIPNFPVKGILFRDFFGVFMNPVLTQYLLDELYYVATSEAARKCKDTVEMQKDAINSGDNVLLLDDVLATGGSLEACVNLVNLSGAKVLFSLLYMELKNLPGRKKLEDLGVPVYSLFQV